MSADIFVHTAWSEGFGKVSLEAAAAGLPVIVFGFYETPIVEDGRNGFVVWTDEEMAARLDGLLRDTSLAMRMGAAGREIAEQWDWRVLAPQWERKIVDLVGNS
jgi:glycosyltransferase involved in cell wall biosynthesis